MLKPFALITFAAHPLPLETRSEVSSQSVMPAPSWRRCRTVQGWNRYSEAKEEFSLWEQASA